MGARLLFYKVLKIRWCRNLGSTPRTWSRYAGEMGRNTKLSLTAGTGEFNLFHFGMPFEGLIHKWTPLLPVRKPTSDRTR